MIPDEAVEAAAKAMHVDAYPADYWDSRPDLRHIFRKRARIALEAAAPHTLAPVWDEGQRAWEDELLGKANGTNPYRSQS